MTRGRSVVDNLGWGAGWGFLFGGVYALYVGALVLLQGPEVVTQYGLSVRDQLLIYLLTGTLGGALVGLFRPLLKFIPVLIGVGVLTGMTFGGLLQLATTGQPISAWDDSTWERIVVLGSLWGVMGSLALRFVVFRDLGKGTRGRCDGDPEP